MNHRIILALMAALGFLFFAFFALDSSSSLKIDLDQESKEQAFPLVEQEYARSSLESQSHEASGSGRFSFVDREGEPVLCTVAVYKKQGFQHYSVERKGIEISKLADADFAVVFGEGVQISLLVLDFAGINSRENQKVLIARGRTLLVDVRDMAGKPVGGVPIHLEPYGGMEISDFQNPPLGIPRADNIHELLARDELLLLDLSRRMKDFKLSSWPLHSRRTDGVTTYSGEIELDFPGGGPGVVWKSGDPGVRRVGWDEREMAQGIGSGKHGSGFFPPNSGVIAPFSSSTSFLHLVRDDVMGIGGRVSSNQVFRIDVPATLTLSRIYRNWDGLPRAEIAMQSMIVSNDEQFLFVGLPPGEYRITGFFSEGEILAPVSWSGVLSDGGVDVGVLSAYSLPEVLIDTGWLDQQSQVIPELEDVSGRPDSINLRIRDVGLPNADEIGFNFPMTLGRRLRVVGLASGSWSFSVSQKPDRSLSADAANLPPPWELYTGKESRQKLVLQENTFAHIVLGRFARNSELKSYFLLPELCSTGFLEIDLLGESTGEVVGSFRELIQNLATVSVTHGLSDGRLMVFSRFTQTEANGEKRTLSGVLALDGGVREPTLLTLVEYPDIHGTILWHNKTKRRASIVPFAIRSYGSESLPGQVVVFAEVDSDSNIVLRGVPAGSKLTTIGSRYSMSWVDGRIQVEQLW